MSSIFERFCYILLTAVFVLIITGSSFAIPTDDNSVVATVGEIKISEKDVNDIAKQRSSRGFIGLSLDEKKKLINKLIAQELFYEEALKKGMDKNPEVVKMLENAKRNILIQHFIDKEISQKVKATKEEIKAYYEKNKSKFTLPDQSIIDAIRITILNKDGAPSAEEVKKKAEEIKTDIINGSSYDDVLKKHKTGPFAELIFFSPNLTIANAGKVADVESVVFKHKIGDTVMVSQKTGFLVIHIKEIIKGKSLPFDQQADVAIGGKIKKEKYDKLYEEYFERLKSKVNVTIDERFFK